MLKKLRLERFKDLEDGELTLGPFTLLVDACASARSSVREALRFLHGIGRGYTLAEIFGGAAPADAQAWEGLGCAAREGAETFALEVEGELSTLGLHFGWYGKWPARYRITVEAPQHRAPRLLEESLHAGWGEMPMLFEAAREGDAPPQGGGHALAVTLGGLWPDLFPPGDKLILPADRPALAQLAESREIERRCGGVLQDLDDLFFATRFPDLAPESTRQPSAAGPQGPCDRGEGLASTLHGLWAHPETRNELLRWLRASAFTGVTDLRFVEDQRGQVQLVLVEKDGAERCATSAPEGALRFLAALATLLSPEPRLVFFEEIDRGLHPASLHVLLGLILSRASRDSLQVVATTRSPALLERLHDAFLEHVSILERREDQPAPRITRLADVPAALRALRTQEQAAS